MLRGCETERYFSNFAPHVEGKHPPSRAGIYESKQRENGLLKHIVSPNTDRTMPYNSRTIFK
jgi:hypothetical protein